MNPLALAREYLTHLENAKPVTAGQTVWERQQARVNAPSATKQKHDPGKAKARRRAARASRQRNRR